MLPIPTDDPKILDKGFQILEDWAHNALLTDEEIDKERGVVLEEYRIGLGAEKRMMNKYLPKVMYKSRYADRLPIGKKEIIENFDYEVLRRFYKDWYRPDLMAVIAVGDVEADLLEAKIEQFFGGIPPVENARERKEYDVPYHEETFVAIESDKEAMFAEVQLMYKDIGEPVRMKTMQDYRTSLMKRLFSQMINARLEEIGNEPNPPYVYGYSFHGGSWARTKDGYQCIAMAPEDKIMASFETLLRENERIKRHGFTAGELNRASETSHLPNGEVL
jgi:zinc protease